MITRLSRSALCALALLMTSAGVGLYARAWAQLPPGQPITLVVPFAAGGGIDSVGRIFAEQLEKKLQQPVLVENRAGAGGIVGTNSVAKAPPDGRTLLLMEASSILARWLHKSTPFDVTRDFTPIAMVATNYLGLFAGPAVAATDVKDLIAYSKAHPTTLAVGTPGVGSPHHLAALMLNNAAGIDITPVPYRGTAPSLNDLLGGRIPLVWAVPITVKPFVEQGKVKALGVSAPGRIPMLPQVPTIAENAVPGFILALWLGIAAPAATPPDVVARLSAAIHAITELPDVQKRMSQLGYDLTFRSGDEFAHLIASEHQKYGAVIRAAGIQPE